MKKVIVFILLISTIIFTSCATISVPNNNKILVVGKLYLNVLDERLNSVEEKINEKIDLRIINSRTGEVLHIRTDNGYYYFVGNPGEDYIISRFITKLPAAESEYYINDYLMFTSPISLKFKTSEKKISYTGELTIVYSFEGFHEQHKRPEHISSGSEVFIKYNIPDIKQYLDEESSDDNITIDKIKKVEVY